LGVLVVPSPAFAAASGPEHVVVYSMGPTGTPRTVVAAGAVNDVGTVVQGPSAPFQANPTWVFPGGSMNVHVAYTSVEADDDSVCIFTGILTGTWQITGGTGAFAGATGGGTFSGPNSHYLTRSADGCDAEYFHVTVFAYDGEVNVPDSATH
jgi:hypothetical protein